MTSPRPAPLFTRSMRRLLGSPMIEALAAPHGVDRYLEAFNPRWSLREVKAQVTAVRHETTDSITLTLKPNSLWNGFRPGQYVRVIVTINGKRISRCYSPANSIHAKDGLIELTAKAHAQGYVSKHLHANAKPGMVLGLSQAESEFALPDARPERILLISGGSGITPAMSMLRTLCDEGYTGRITFLHYAFTAKDVIYASELETLARRHPNLQLLRAYTTPSDGGELSGLFSREHLLQAVPDYAQAQTFLCGPPGLMKTIEAVWAEDGIAEHLHLERFTAAPIVVDSTNAQGEVRFARSERFASNTGSTLLDQAEAAGLKPEAGCRMGICHTCTCRKTSGQVRDVRTGEISASGEEDIQICVSVPVGTVTLDL